MSRKRGKVDYAEVSSSDEEDQDQFNEEKPQKKPAKKKCSTKTQMNKGKRRKSRAELKVRAPYTSTSGQSTSAFKHSFTDFSALARNPYDILSDSDEDVGTPAVGLSQTSRDKIDNFFKQLESRSANYEPSTQAPSTSVKPEPTPSIIKDAAFYYLSDSDIELEKSVEDEDKSANKSSAPPTASSPKPSTSGLTSQDSFAHVALPSTSIIPEHTPYTIKSASFYTLSDSEEDVKKSVGDKSPVEIISYPTASLPKPSTSGLNLKSQKAFDLVACLAISSDESDEEEKASEKDKAADGLSLQELKRRTQAILDEVESSFKTMYPEQYPEQLPEQLPEPEPVPNPPASELEAPSCPVCLEEYDGGPRQAMATLCGHLFCKKCITSVATTTKKCPTCRKGINKKKYHPVYI